jgi:excisionase family DNA binding protein
MTKEISFNDIPQALVYLIGKIESIEQALQVQNEQPKTPGDVWMNINELMEYLPDKPARATVYGWVSSRQIPHHKGGKRLRFRQSEIDTWLSSGKRQSNEETEAAAQAYLIGKKKGV